VSGRELLLGPVEQFADFVVGRWARFCQPQTSRQSVREPGLTVGPVRLGDLLQRVAGQLLVVGLEREIARGDDAV